MQASGTIVKCGATVCREAQLEDYIVGVVKSKGVLIDVLVLGFRVDHSKKASFLRR